jgi:hypothetical protein
VTLALYLDDCAFSYSLQARLIRAGHRVTIPVDVEMREVGDEEHLAYVVQHGLVLLTKNPKDFVDLHDGLLAAGGGHAGILLVYQDNDTTRDMSDADIVGAVAHVEEIHGTTGLANQLFILNQFRW